MRSRRLLVAVASVLSVAVLGLGPASADIKDGETNATVKVIDNTTVELAMFEAGHRIVGPAAPAWLAKCTWYETTRYGADLAYAEYGARAEPTDEYYDVLGTDPEEPFALVACDRTADVIAAVPIVAVTGYLGAWPIGGEPPRLILDWLVASTRARVDLPVQIGSSAPTGVDANNSWVTQVESWLWVDPTVWQPQSVRSEALFGTYVTVTATPYEVTFEDDDGHFVNCGDNVGRVWSPSVSRGATTRCGITPEHTSHTGDRSLTSTIRWRVTYACNQYCGSDSLDDFVVRNTRPILTHERLVIES